MPRAPLISLAGLATTIAWPLQRQAPADLPRSSFSITQGCEGDSGEIVVCGRRRDDERYRLPLRDLESAALGAGPVRGEVPRASAGSNPTASCGIFEGQRRCNRREMAEFRYHRGRDPVSAGTSIVEAVTDPD